MQFFIANPTGRILNRFSKDQNSIDEMLPVTFFAFMETAIYCLAAVVLICVVIPYLTILIPFLGIIYICILYIYLYVYIYPCAYISIL